MYTIEIHESKPLGRCITVTITVKDEGAVIKKMDFITGLNEKVVLKVVK